MNSWACVTDFIKDFLCGLKDSLLGFTTVSKIDECVFLEQRNVPKRSTVPKVSTLARKRAEKLCSPTSNEENTVHITKQKKSVSARLTDCCVTNGILGCLAYGIVFGIVQPGLKFLYTSITGYHSSPTWTRLVWWAMSNFYFALILLFTKALNLLWFQDIAEVSYRKVRGRPQTEKLGILIADLAFTFFQQILFFLQAIFVSILVRYFLFKLLAEVVYMFHIVLLHSLYTYEYKWFQMGWPAYQRLSYIENHWPYFLGFGMLQGCLTYFIPSFYASSFLLALLFPIMIVGANEAKTVPTQVDRPLQLFYLVGQLTDVLFKTTLEYRKQYVPWMVPLTSLASRMFLGLFSHLYVPACYLIMSISLPTIAVMNFCKSHKVFAVVVSTVLIVAVFFSYVIKKYFAFVL